MANRALVDKSTDTHDALPRSSIRTIKKSSTLEFVARLEKGSQEKTAVPMLIATVAMFALWSDGGGALGGT